MTYEITERDFLNLAERTPCLGTEKNKGLAKDGHENCNFCKGNYFVGGECNYGGEHLMTDDLRIINRNFRQFDTLENRKITLDGSKNEKTFNNAKQSLLTKFEELERKCQDDVSTQEFFSGTCVGIGNAHNAFLKKIQNLLKLLAGDLRKYIETLTKTTWEQLKTFQEKKEKLGKLQQEANQMLGQWKNEKDPLKKKQLWAAYQDKFQEGINFLEEMKKDPVYDLFSDEKEKELQNIVKNLWSGQDTFLKFQAKNKEGEEEKTYFGFIPQKWGKLITWGGIGLVILLIIFFLYRWVKSKL